MNFSANKGSVYAQIISTSLFYHVFYHELRDKFDSALCTNNIYASLQEFSLVSANIVLERLQKHFIKYKIKNSFGTKLRVVIKIEIEIKLEENCIFNFLKLFVMKTHYFMLFI